MYNTSVQAIGKHINFRHLTTAVDSTTLCHNNNKKVFTKFDKAYENCILWNLVEL